MNSLLLVLLGVACTLSASFELHQSPVISLPSIARGLEVSDNGEEMALSMRYVDTYVFKNNGSGFAEEARLGTGGYNLAVDGQCDNLVIENYSSTLIFSR